jgi:penicillin-binding protein 1B
LGFRIRIARGFWTTRLGIALLCATGVLFLAGVTTFTYFYVQYSRLIDQRLGGQAFRNTSRVFAAPPRLYTGQTMKKEELVAHLQRTGYSDSEVSGSVGRYRVTGATVEIRPLAQSFFRGQNAIRVEFEGEEVARIRSLRTGEAAASAEIEPEVITSLFDSTREKRRLMRFADMPKVMVDAVVTAEDKRFFEHPGFDPFRVVGAAWADLRGGGITQGASTITMQTARSFFFSLERRGWAAWRRKAAETFMALMLEQRFTKEEIFELYANEIYLGNRASFAIHGFGEGARAYFGKDLREVSLGEAAFLGGIIRSPNRYAGAERNPERAAEARDRVLKQLVENGVVEARQADEARKAGLRFAHPAREAGAAPYFVDMVRDHLLERVDETILAHQSYRIYTTLDPQLQRAATEAVAVGIAEVDKLLAKKYERWHKEKKPAQVQVALVAVDPRTGEVKALVGGRDYGQSQLNRALAQRQPGSVFKPFVYAAAMANAAEGLLPVLTPVSTVVDEPTTFLYEDKEYSPNNYGAEYHGTVTLRAALRQSLNVAAVKVAELVGYARVVEIGRQIGLDKSIKATPAVALGAYEMSPVDVAAAYTVFVNDGVRAEPFFLRSVQAGDGSPLEHTKPRTRKALDERVAYLVTNLMEDVVNRGTAAGVRTRGFTAPAAGKTGTSHDGWFAGFTSNLLCVVWVGFDDNRELGYSGANTAAPIWAEFMKRAVSAPGYRNTESFLPPEGIRVAQIDPDTLELATPACPKTSTEVFLEGSEPGPCSRHGGRNLITSSVGWLSGVFGGKKDQDKEAASASATGGNGATANGPSKGPAPPSAGRADSAQPAKAPPPDATSPGATKPEEEKKKGPLSRVFGIFAGGKKDKDKEKAKQDPAPKPPPS